MQQQNTDAQGTEDRRALTNGEVFVGLDFNPSAREDVDEVKRICARLVDIVEKGNGQETKYPYYVNTFKGDALRRILHAQMAAVKSLTFNK